MIFILHFIWVNIYATLHSLRESKIGIHVNRLGYIL